MSECKKCVHYPICDHDSATRTQCSFYEEPRPRGEWIIRRDKQGVHIYSVCSICNVPHLDTDFPNFCENCGSDNRKKEDEPHGS